MNYVTYDPETGELTGIYLQDLQPEHQFTYIEITEPLVEHWTRYKANAERDGLELLPEPEPVEPPVPAHHITKTAFRMRFPMPVKVAIELAALDDPGAALEQRQQAAALRVYLADLYAAPFVDLEHPSTTDGVAMLVAAGIATQEEADAILSIEIAEHERYYP